ncbi:MAG: phosphatase PAP2 family protein [Ignavibacteriaceae bacterium]|jgi:membrane-associated phospholipid phosphatase
MQLQSEKGEKQLKNFSYRTARIISTLFVPPTLTLFSFLYLGLQLEPTSAKQVVVIGSGLLWTFLLPIIFFVIMLKKKKIINQDAELKEERTFPFLFGLSLLLIGYFLLRVFNVQPLTQTFWLCYIINTGAIILINKTWKISIHALGIAAPLALFSFMESWIAVPLLLLLFLVGWSRIYLKCHTFAQVIAGAFFGFISTYLQLYLFLR